MGDKSESESDIPADIIATVTAIIFARARKRYQ
jgi:hypothetical protein